MRHGMYASKAVPGMPSLPSYSISSLGELCVGKHIGLYRTSRLTALSFLLLP
jgi:hypothetical protein